MTPSSGDLQRVLAGMPKVDLHRHLEGSVRFETFLDLVLPQDVPLPSRDPDVLRRLVEVQPDELPNFTNFLSKFALLHTIYATPDAYARVLREAVQDAAREGVVHLELRISLRHLTRHKGFPMTDVLRWLHEARQSAEREFDVSVVLVAMLNREAPREVCEQIMGAVLAQPNGVVAGVDLAGDELNYPVPPVADLYDAARQRGLGITIHAGEAREAAVVDRCLTTFRPTRIGHGVRSSESPSTMRRLIDEGIVLEVCPISNTQTGAAPALRGHPIKTLYDAGVLVTVNTDDPGISRTSIVDEYTGAVEQIGFTPEDLARMNLRAAEASFLPSDRKRRLLKRLRAADGAPPVA